MPDHNLYGIPNISSLIPHGWGLGHPFLLISENWVEQFRPGTSSIEQNYLFRIFYSHYYNIKVAKGVEIGIKSISSRGLHNKCGLIWFTADESHLASADQIERCLPIPFTLQPMIQSFPRGQASLSREVFPGVSTWTDCLTENKKRLLLEPTYPSTEHRNSPGLWIGGPM